MSARRIRAFVGAALVVVGLSASWGLAPPAGAAAGCDAPAFRAAASVGVGLRPVHAAAGDLDGDGRADLVVSNGTSPFVSIIYGSASGAFAATSLDVGGSNQVAVADFNHDGKADLLTGRGLSVELRLGDGAGGFGPPSAAEVPSSAPLVVADFNHDGDLDVFTGSQSFSSSRMLLGDGAGHLTPTGAFLNLPVHSAAAAGDFNGDTFADLVLGGPGDGFSVAIGNAAGNFGPASFYDAPAGERLAVADFNGDGRDDVAVGGSLSNSVHVRLANGSGGFGPVVSTPAGGPVRSLAPGDFNADGRPDLAAATGPEGAYKGRLSILRGDGAGGFTQGAGHVTGARPPVAVAAGDFDGDGRLDAAAINASGNSVVGTTPGSASVFLGDGAGGLLAPAAHAVGSNPFSIAAGDVNGDGRADLAFPHVAGHAVVLRGNGAGGFLAPLNVNLGMRPTGVALADVSGDGRLDLVGTDFGTDRVAVARGNGAGGFGPALFLSAGSAPVHAAAADLNLDGRPDLAVANYNGGVAVYLGDGAGGFGAPTEFHVGSNVQHVTFGDFNDDGRPDLAASTQEGVAVRLGDGAGGFGATSTLAIASAVYQTAVGDFDGDGRADLAGANGSTGFVSVFLRTGPGAFAASKTFAVEGAADIVVADFNGDGLDDLATGDSSYGTTSVLLGDGAGDFAPPARKLTGGPVPSALVAADFNGDARPDLAFANHGGTSIPEVDAAPGNVTVLLNTCAAPAAPPPRLSAAAASVNEGDAGTTNVAVNVTLSAASARTVSVGFYNFGQTAAKGADFTPAAGRLVFNPGETSKTVNLAVAGDRRDEFDETFGLALALPLGATAAGPAQVTVLDNDPPPAASASDATRAEGTGASAAASVSVRLAAASGKPVTVAYATADGTARAGSDYAAASGTLSFAPGETQKTISVTVVADAAFEPDETFFVNLSAPVNVTLADAQAQVTLANDDAGVEFGAAGATFSEKAGSVSVNVTRFGALTGTTVVSYATADATATERSDYILALGELRFAPGETTKTISVLVVDDVLAEGDETFRVVLSGPAGGSLGARAQFTATLTSDDAATGPSPVGGAAFNPAFFVRQHYLDFLNRQPDAGGLQFWTNNITSCGADARCAALRRVDTSAAFFLSIEFQETGYFVYRMYKAAYGDISPPAVPVPVRLREFMPDTQEVGRGVQVGVGNWQAQLEANKREYTREFVAGARFRAAHPASLTPAQFVARLNANTGGALTAQEEAQLASQLAAAGNSEQARAATLRAVAEHAEVARREFRRAFVLMQYFGYLRRDPDAAPDRNFDGWRFWLTKLNDFDGDYRAAEMVRAFIESIEYTHRFGR